MVAKMLRIFEEIPKYFDDSRRPVTQCFMCHQGRVTPERLGNLGLHRHELPELVIDLGEWRIAIGTIVAAGVGTW